MDNKYNGWANRSTWLAKLHLDNDSEEVNNRAHELGVQADTIKQFKNLIVPVLRHETTVSREQSFDWNEVDYNELWDAFRITK